MFNSRVITAAIVMVGKDYGSDRPGVARVVSHSWIKVRPRFGNGARGLKKFFRKVGQFLPETAHPGTETPKRVRTDQPDTKMKKSTIPLAIITLTLAFTQMPPETGAAPFREIRSGDVITLSMQVNGDDRHGMLTWYPGNWVSVDKVTQESQVAIASGRQQ